MNIKTRLLLGCGFVSVLATGGGRVLAQSAPTPSSSQVAADEAATPTELGAVVVTASRREQTLLNVPQAVQALTPQVLSRTGTQDLKSTISLIPGATETSEEAAGTESYAIRGVAAGETFGDSTVGYYLDEFGFSIPGEPFAPSADVYDVQRVEVLRGPSGTLYGQGSLGGTIKVLTNDPDFSGFNGSVRATVGATDEGSVSYDTDLMVNAPLIDNVLSVRAVVNDERIGGYINFPNIPLRNGNYVDVISGRVKVLFEPTSRLKIVLSYWGNSTNTNISNRMDNYDPYEANDLAGGKLPVAYSIYMAKINYDLGFADLLSSTNYLRETSDAIANGNQGPPFGAYHIIFNDTNGAFSQEFRITSKGDNLINYVAGAYFQRSFLIHDDVIDLSGSTVPPAAPEIGETGTEKTNSKQYAVYGELSANLLNGFLVPTIGGRYFSEHRTLDGFTALSLFGGAPMPTYDQTGGNDNAFTPRFNLAIHPSPHGMFYVEVSEGFRSGYVQSHATVEAYSALGIPAVTSNPADTLWNFEVGEKWSFFSGALYDEIAIYDYIWNHAQLQFAPDGLGGVIGVGDGRGTGGDLTLRYRPPIQGLEVGVMGNLNDTELSNVNPSAAAVGPWFADGKQLPGASRVTGAVDGEYMKPLPNLPYNLDLDARFVYRSRSRDSVTGRMAADVGLLYLRAGISDSRKSLFAFINNVTDSRGPSSIDSGRYQTPYPREYGVTLETKF